MPSGYPQRDARKAVTATSTTSAKVAMRSFQPLVTLTPPARRNQNQAYHSRHNGKAFLENRAAS